MESMNQEYAQAFRTKSYAEMWGKLFESQVTTSTTLDSPLPPQDHPSESLLEPGQETLANMAKSFDLQPLLVEYFDETSNACNVYVSLLLSVHRALADFRKVEDVITLGREEFDEDTGCRGNGVHKEAQGELSGYVRLQDSLSIFSMDKFRDVHDGYTVLLHNLVNQHRQRGGGGSYPQFLFK